jgi:hypothetical protein
MITYDEDQGQGAAGVIGVQWIGETSILQENHIKLMVPL